LPTYEKTATCKRDWRDLSPTDKRAFLAALKLFMTDLKVGKFRKGLRVKKIVGAKGIFEMTWADDGRATFQFGRPVKRGEKHVIWRRIGSHVVFREP